ncbi:MAG: nucleotidyltransferase family protein [Candidatus Micrarchaeia archaeon]
MASQQGKEKIAISIDKALLHRVDARVDGSTIKSRSHAIELLLLQALGGTGSDLHALILCGGEGKGLRPLTYKIPKPMVEVGGKPILQRIVEWLKASNITKATFAIGYMGEDISSYFGDGNSFGVSIDYAKEREPLGTAGAVNAMRERAQGTFLVLNGDVLCSFDLRAMLEAHRRSNAVATMALKSVRDAGHYGVVEMEGDKVTKFEESSKTSGESKLVNAGVYVLSSKIFDYLPAKGMLEHDVFPKLAQKGLMRGYVFTGPWVDVTDKQSLMQAEDEIE